jgi:hypothetical protein
MRVRAFRSVAVLALVTVGCASGPSMRKEWVRIDGGPTTLQAYSKDKYECSQEVRPSLEFGPAAIILLKRSRTSEMIEMCMMARGWEERRVPKGTGVDD